jgi:hypothetical protein
MLRPVPIVILLIRNSEIFYDGESEAYGVWKVMPCTVMYGFLHNFRILSILHGFISQKTKSVYPEDGCNRFNWKSWLGGLQSFVFGISGSKPGSLLSGQSFFVIFLRPFAQVPVEYVPHPFQFIINSSYNFCLYTLSYQQYGYINLKYKRIISIDHRCSRVFGMLVGLVFIIVLASRPAGITALGNKQFKARSSVVFLLRWRLHVHELRRLRY